MNNKELKFNIKIKIADPNNFNKHNTLNLKAVFSYTNNNYGNGYYLCIKGVNGTKFERYMDLRYENFNPNTAEIYLAMWAYGNWTGDNGSYDVVSLSIDMIEALPQKKKVHNPLDDFRLE